MADVAFEHVTKRYGGQSAVINDLNLRVRDHEFLILVGPSGCGKSTALRMIAGLEEISEGELTIGGQRMNDIPPKDRDIAMVFQNYALYPHMSVRDNLAFSLKLRGTPTSEITERVKRAAETLGLGEYLARRPRELSGGQRQRVALGRALVRQPQVFLLDEPLSNLDAKLRVQTRAEIARLHQTTGTTFVYVTHDQVEAMTMGDRIAVMNAGVIQQLGAPQELYDRPANLFVAGFIGSPAMSFLSARLVGVGDAATVTFEGSEGRAVIAGVRPEHLRLANDGAGAISGVVELVEHLGNEQLLYISTPAALALEPAGQPRADGALERPRIVARLSAAERATPGANVSLAIDPARLHLFDLASGSRLAGDLEGVMA